MTDPGLATGDASAAQTGPEPRACSPGTARPGRPVATLAEGSWSVAVRPY